MERPAGRWLRVALRATAPTKEGWGLLVAGLNLLVFAYATQRSSLFAAASLALALYLVGHLGAAWAGASLEASWDCPERVFAGEEFPLRLRLCNRGPVAVAGVEVHESSAGEGRPAVVVPAVAAGASAAIEVRGRVHRRGHHRLEAPGVRVAWPFHVAAAVIESGPDRDLLAYPRRIAVPSGVLRSLAPDAAAREAAASMPRGGDVLRAVREWAPGDAPRAIAWRATARHDRLLTREFEREDSGRAVVLLDADPRDQPLTAVERRTAVGQACSLAASLLLRLRAEGRRTTFAAWMPEAAVVPSVASRSGLGRALEALALLEPPRGRDPHRDPLTLLPPGSLRGARVLLVKAGSGPIRTSRRGRGVEVVTIPALRSVPGPGVRA